MLDMEWKGLQLREAGDFLDRLGVAWLEPGYFTVGEVLDMGTVRELTVPQLRLIIRLAKVGYETLTLSENTPGRPGVKEEVW